MEPPVSMPLVLPGEESAHSVFLAWEKLRVVFNAALVFVVLLSAGSALLDGKFWHFLAEGALIANLCFCLGPVAEGYLIFFGVNRQAVRWIVFALGALLGCLLAFAAVFAWRMQGFD